MKINLHENPRPFVVEDLALFEARKVDPCKQHAIAKWILAQKWFKPVAKAHRIDSIINNPACSDLAISEMCWMALQIDFDRIRENGKDPDWLEFLPLEAVRRLEHLWIVGDGPDQYKIVPSMAHVGIGYVVRFGGLVEEIDEVFGLHRLNGVAQLGLLHDPTILENGWRQYPMPFPQTRYVHSLDVHAIATLIGKMLDLSEEKLRTLRVAGQSHDALTPAGGDTTKGIDRKGFDEDVHYPDLFLREGWKELRSRYGLSEAELVQTILGKGLLGSILDVSDKLAYVGRDLDKFLGHNPTGQAAWENFGATYYRIVAILNQNPYPCSVWDCVELINGEMVFTNAERLADFLLMRSLMFKILYNNASARFYEAGFGEEVASVLYGQGVLTKKSLLAMTDIELSRVIGRELGIKEYYHGVNLTGTENPRVLEFETKRQALAFQRQLVLEEPRAMMHYELVRSPSTSCLQNFKVLHNGNVMAFKQACPQQAYDVVSIACDSKPHKVFVYDLSMLCGNVKLTRRLLQRRDARIAK